MSHSPALSLPAQRIAQGVITLPGSKSISNRTLLLAALSHGETVVKNLLASDDTEVMLSELIKLGVKVEKQASGDVHITGCDGVFPVVAAELSLGNAGTAFRPLTAVLALQRGRYTLSGVARMHERPIGDLVDALNALGADIGYLRNPGYPPLVIRQFRGQTTAHIQVRGDVSSQFLTALLLAAPLQENALTIDVVGELISKPYIEITINLMARFGVSVERKDWRSFIVPADAQYKTPGLIHVEGDASSASYFLAAGVLGIGPVRVLGVGSTSIQGDTRFAHALTMMGATVTMGEDWIEAKAGRTLHAIDLDCNHIPDAAMTLAVLALFAEGTTTLHNIASWRVKETDRIAAMATELRKLGAVVEEGTDFLRITPPEGKLLTANALIDTYDDHRMAMCFSLVSLGVCGVPVTINDPACVNKTFPNYFEALKKVLAA